MITCRELAELLIDFSSGEILAERRDHVEQHLRRCPSCVAYLESYRLTIQMAHQVPCAPLPPRLVRQLRALLQEAGRIQRLESHGGTPGAEEGPRTSCKKRFRGARRPQACLPALSG